MKGQSFPNDGHSQKQHKFNETNSNIEHNFITKIYEADYLKHSSAHNQDNFMSDLLQEWLPMESQESLHYLTAFEVCQATTNGKNSWCEKFRSDICGSCCIGSMKEFGFGSCPSSRLSHLLFRHKSTKIWPESKTIIDFIYLMKTSGFHTLILLGDSISRQYFLEIHCQLRRFGIFALNELGTKEHQFHLHYDMKAFDSQYVQRVTNALRNNLPELPKNMTERFNLKYISYTHGKIEDNGFNQQFKYAHDYIQSLENNSAIIIANLGLHHNTPQYYTSAMKYLINFSLEIMRNKSAIVMFRETSAQHFNTRTGIYTEAGTFLPRLYADQDGMRKIFKGELNSTVNEVHQLYKSDWFYPKCKSFANKEIYDEQNWRNEIAAKILEEVDPGHRLMPIIPFYRLSAARFDLHPTDLDCTHFCHGPMFWAPVIQHMYNLLRLRLEPQNQNAVAFQGN